MTSSGYILIVGGAGYIGSHVNKLLNRRGYRTVVLDNLIYGHQEFVKWGDFVLGDIADPDQIRLCFRKYPIYAVMHFGAYAYVGESVIDPAKYYVNNVVNTVNLLNILKEFEVKYFIFSSSCATYGLPDEIPIAEDHVQKPINPYGTSKLMVENILRDYGKAYGMEHVNLRYFNAAGADPECEIGEWHDPETHLIPLALDVASGKRDHIKIFGSNYNTHDGTCIRDYIHVQDLAEAHLIALEYLLQGGKSDSFNLGYGRGFSVREVLKSAEEISGKNIKTIEWHPREGDPPVLVGSAKKAIDILKWKPQFDDLELIIETAWKWHKR